MPYHLETSLQFGVFQDALKKTSGAIVTRLYCKVMNCCFEDVSAVFSQVSFCLPRPSSAPQDGVTKV